MKLLILIVMILTSFISKGQTNKVDINLLRISSGVYLNYTPLIKRDTSKVQMLFWPTRQGECPRVIYGFSVGIRHSAMEDVYYHTDIKYFDTSFVSIETPIVSQQYNWK